MLSQWVPKVLFKVSRIWEHAKLETDCEHVNPPVTESSALSCRTGRYKAGTAIFCKESFQKQV